MKKTKTKGLERRQRLLLTDPNGVFETINEDSHTRGRK